MFKKILHPNDGSDQAFDALALALQIAKHDHAELHMVSVAQRRQPPEPVEERAKDPGTIRFNQVLQRGRYMAEQSQVKFQSHALAGNIVRDVVRLASELKADLIVVGASGHSAPYDRMIGSRTQRILYLATCPVLVVR
jgi:nucleotide-binding universal stress UspA family protein